MRTFEERFWAKVNRLGPDECWIWTGARSRQGYGNFFLSPKVQLAHRVSYAMHVGVIPEGMYVCHTCDNPPCVNPRHLWLGTSDDNMADMAHKGRGRTALRAGSLNPNAKLDEATVFALKTDYVAGMPQARLCEKYGLSRTAVSRIIRGRRWTHVIAKAVQG